MTEAARLTSGGWQTIERPQRSDTGSAYVETPADRVGIGVVREVLDLTTTPQTLTFAGGLLSAEISFLDLGSAVGDWVFVVFDALSDSDAAAKLATTEARVRIMLGETGAREFVFDASSPVYRIDMASNVASETGDSVVRLLGKVAA